MPETHPNLPLEHDWAAGDNVKTGMDANLRLLGAVVQLAVESRTSDEPGTPTNGDRYIHNGGTWSVGNAGDVIARIAGAWYAYAPADGWLAKCRDEERWIEYQGSGSAWVGFAEVLHNDSATRDPVGTDDTDAGYSAGSRWYNTNNGELFRCVDATAGDADWLKTTLTLDELGSAATADKTGADADVVSGTAGTGGNLAEWNEDGDAVDSGVDASQATQANVTETVTEKWNFEADAQIDGSDIGPIESGTFTPVLAGKDTAGNHTYTFQTGHYERRGNIVLVTLRITVDVLDTDISGNLEITGLPYSGVNREESALPVEMFSKTGNSYPSNFTMFVGRVSSDNVDLGYQTTSGGGGFLGANHLGDGADFRSSFTYKIA